MGNETFYGDGLTIERLERLRFTFTAYGIRQTANVSGEFLRIENKQLKKVRTILVDKTSIKLLIFV